ncbi:MAG: aminotransferase class IV [Rhodobacteraceae bacterium]|nr:aminotransferase class IV [Paracoccaceae bacterium]
MFWDGAHFPRLEGHLARLAASARALGFRHDPSAVARALAVPEGAPLRVRLTLGPAGDAAVGTAPLPPPPPAGGWRLALAPARLASTDPLLRHKTTFRPLYDAARAALPAGIDEMVFLNERGEACEGTITTLFFDLGQGLSTPPLACGCLPGVLRAELLAAGRCREAVLPAADLPRARLWMGNALRGLVPSRLA